MLDDAAWPGCGLFKYVKAFHVLLEPQEQQH